MLATAEVFETQRTKDYVFELPENFESLKESSEQEKSSFDLTASVNMFRYDLKNFGEIQAETHQRVYDEELTFVAEGIDRHCYTTFTLQDNQKDGLVLFKEGKWQPYRGMLLTGLETAKKETKNDYRRKFLEDWAVRDLQIGFALEELKPGQVLNWNSPFAEEESQLYGKRFMLDCGLQPERRMGFIYRAQRDADGSVTLESHTVDNSDTDGFAAVEQLLENDPEANITSQIEAYDDAMLKKHGREYEAGRLKGKDDGINAYNFIETNKQYVDYYMDEITALAKSQLEGESLKTAKKDLTYGFWASLKELLNEQRPAPDNTAFYNPNPIQHQDLSRNQIAFRVSQAYTRASERGEVMAGCGGSVSVKSLSEMEPDDALDSVFGVDKKKELSWHGGRIKKGRCVNCHEGPKDVGVKNWCKNCISGHCG